MAYIGRSPTSGIRETFIYTASGGETSITGPDDNGRTLKFDNKNYVDVLLNGVLLVQGDDYTLPDRNTVASLPSLEADDIVTVIAYGSFSIADHYTKDQADSSFSNAKRQQETISGLILSNNSTDSDHDIDISSGVTVGRTGSGGFDFIELDSTKTISIDNSADRVDGSTLDVDEHYNVLIGLSGGSVVAGFSKTKALPSGWDFFRRIGSVFTDGSSNVRQFTQEGDIYKYRQYVLTIDDNSLTDDNTESVSIHAPPNTHAFGYADVVCSSNSSTIKMAIFEKGITEQGDYHEEIGRLSSGSTDLRQLGNTWEAFTDFVSQISYRVIQTGGTLDRFIIMIRGWTDDRGRND